jgi:methionine aminopeptidase
MNHIKNIREAVANYMSSEGCACCRNIEAHKLHEAHLAKLLRVPKYKDGSGYDFGRFRTKRVVSAGAKDAP